MTGLLGADVTLPPGALVPVIILGVVEIGLAVFCIVDIIRRPAVLGGHKWLWILLVVFFNLIGSIVYLAVGREHPPAAETRAEPEAATRSRAQAAADMLYGPAAGAGAQTGGDSGPDAADSASGADAAPGAPAR